jgi:6-phosphogluconolactonase
METLVIRGSHGQTHVLKDLEAISHHACSLFIRFASDSLARKETFAVALSGGSTPKRFYVLLGSDPYRNQIDWRRVHCFWADERCVPQDHEDSNFRMAFDLLLSKISIPSENLHRIKGEGIPERSAKDYEDTLVRFFGDSGFPVFDLIILGMGEDGHTASLFPGSKWLEERKRFAVPVHLEEPNRDRVSLTLPVLNHAGQVLLLVAGHSKAVVLAHILEDGPQEITYPAALIHPIRGDLTWLIEEEAASLLDWRSVNGKR